MKGIIFDIKKFAVHDGNGIRTTVFFKGCPLHCLWCHNPEGIDFSAQLAFFEDLCVGCGACAKICQNEAHQIKNNRHVFLREQCLDCGKCAESCLTGALKMYGRNITIEELLPILTEDREFYDISGGGVTLSGGECLMQPEFCYQLLKALKGEGIDTAVDTCGYISKETLDKVMPYTDTFLYDVKAYDEDVHIKCTGYSNQQILENLKYIDSSGKKTEIRIPFVPQYNDTQIEKIAGFLKQLKNITQVRVLPYHNYAGSKYLAIDRNNTLPNRLPAQKEIFEAADILRSFGLTVLM